MRDESETVSREHPGCGRPRLAAAITDSLTFIPHSSFLLRHHDVVEE